MNIRRGDVPAGYRAVPVIAWSAVFLGIVLPVAVALVLAAYPHSQAVLCATRQVQVGPGSVTFPGPGTPVLYPMPVLAVTLVWPGVACALVVTASGLVRYGRSVLDSTRTLGWGALGLLGVVLVVANGIMVYLVYHGGLGLAVVCG